jgi:hypothetical protein
MFMWDNMLNGIGGAMPSATRIVAVAKRYVVSVGLRWKDELV